jgi:dipeptidyl aminopeptidase/acylaminoacyl peptidase
MLRPDIRSAREFGMTVPPEAWAAIGAATTPVFSRDGHTIWHLRGAGLNEVWAMDRAGSNARAATAHGEKTWKLSRSPADERLIWAVDAGGDERHQLWLREADGTVRALTGSPEVIHDFGCWAPDGKRIAFAANDRDARFFDIVVMELGNGGRRRLLEGRQILTAPSWSPAARPGPAALVVVEDFSSTDQRLAVVDVDSGAAADVPRTAPARFAAVRWENGGAALLGLTDAGGSDFMRLCRIDPASGEVTPLHAPEERDVEAWSLSPDFTQLATVENDRGYARLRVGPADDDRPEVVGLPEGTIGDLAWAPDGSALAFALSGPTAPPGLWLWEAGRVRALWRPDPAAEAGIDPGRFIPPALVEWESFDGLYNPGFYATPHGHAPTGGWPAIVWVHGGPAAQTRANFRPDMQMLLDAGFAVLMPNLRGSTGYGRAYLEADEVANRPDYLRDLEACHAWLAARKEIDARRIGIMGQSYGGWAVLAALTLQPELWAAGCDYYGIADFATLLANTSPWRRDHRAREYGFAGVDDDVFEEISPLRHVERVRAPLLVLHAERDPRVPMSESEQFVAAMRERGKPVTYERFAWAGHGFNAAEDRARVYRAVAQHFGRHLAGAA